MIAVNTSMTTASTVPRYARPILFSAPMVHSILAGAKTQTRRVVTPQPTRSLPHTESIAGDFCIHHPMGWRWKTSFTADSIGGVAAMSSLIDQCRYGMVGDLLWVRETWGLLHTQPSDGPSDAYVFYRASDGERRDLRYQRWRPSIHMPRWASRITLEVTAVRVERVRDITADDARAEGVDVTAGVHGANWDARDFAALWDNINGKRAGCAWGDNPWVWRIEFRRVQP